MSGSQYINIQPNPKIQKFVPGDTVKVNFKIKEGERERVQAFQGVVIRERGEGPGATVTVRRVASGVGVERMFPLHSPLLDSIDVMRAGDVRRARLYYLRGLTGRSARIKEKGFGAGALSLSVKNVAPGLSAPAEASQGAAESQAEGSQGKESSQGSAGLKEGA